MSMSNETLTHPVALIIGFALVGSIVDTTVANASENPFGATELASGYSLARAEGKSDERKAQEPEGKCGEGKCGGSKGTKGKEGKCGEGKCGTDVMPEQPSSLEGDPCKINSNLPQCM